MTQQGSPGERRAQASFGTAGRADQFYNNQVLAYLNPHMREFIARQEMVCIATAGADGACDCSLRSGPPGFVQVVDDKTLVYPEYRGNGVFASVGNILENPRIGLLFVDYFQSTVGLHVNGTARVLSNDDILSRPDGPASLAEAAKQRGGRRPECWIAVGIEEAYIHCSKHVPLLAKRDKPLAWGTDDEAAKGGDYFKAKPEPRCSTT
ncbi:MAG TPA: pyridoxamine 5'-phosphate oxidase family protein [Nitrospiraceae bacterium]|nr:pyridoxamine 5'-phosphate oxidase family protein [Nitrospiraceae bacterium]